MSRGGRRLLLLFFFSGWMGAAVLGCQGAPVTNWVCSDSRLTGCAPDFRLEDKNPSSSTFGRKVSPRDFMGQISAFYFGAAT